MLVNMIVILIIFLPCAFINPVIMGIADKMDNSFDANNSQILFMSAIGPVGTFIVLVAITAIYLRDKENILVKLYKVGKK